MKTNSSVKTEEERYNDPQTGKFVVGNPGKPKGSRHMSTLLEEAIKKVAEGSNDPEDIQIVRKVIEQAKKGDMKAVEHIWDRLEGKAPQKIDVTSDDEKLSTSTLDVELLAIRMAEELKKKKT